VILLADSLPSRLRDNFERLLDGRAGRLEAVEPPLTSSTRFAIRCLGAWSMRARYPGSPNLAPTAVMQGAAGGARVGRVTLVGSCAAAFVVMLPVAVIAAIIGGAVGWVVLAAGAAAVGLGLGVVSRREGAHRR
jgi:hypothetical protein